MEKLEQAVGIALSGPRIVEKNTENLRKRNTYEGVKKIDDGTVHDNTSVKYWM